MPQCSGLLEAKNAKMSRCSFWHRLATVRQKRVQEALQALREGFERAGKPLKEPTIDFATRVAKDPRLRRILEERREQLALRAALAGALVGAGKNNDPEEKWRQFLEKMKNEFPYMVRPGLQAKMKVETKDLPRRPGTGRHRLLTLGERRKACDLVAKYIRAGDSFRTAYEKVASELNCSPRTAQRAWQERHTLPSAMRSRSRMGR